MNLAWLFFIFQGSVTAQEAEITTPAVPVDSENGNSTESENNEGVEKPENPTENDDETLQNGTTTTDTPLVRPITR